MIFISISLSQTRTFRNETFWMSFTNFSGVKVHLILFFLYCLCCLGEIFNYNTQHTRTSWKITIDDTLTHVDKSKFCLLFTPHEKMTNKKPLCLTHWHTYTQITPKTSFTAQRLDFESGMINQMAHNNVEKIIYGVQNNLIVTDLAWFWSFYKLYQRFIMTKFQRFCLQTSSQSKGCVQFSLEDG